MLDSVKVLAAAQFGQVRSCPGDSSSLKDVSTFLPGASIVSWEWDFGDPASGAANQSNQRDVKHQYATAGPYPVSLTITASGGCTSTYSENVVVPEFPTLVPVPQTALCAGNATPLAITETADLTFVSWNFDDPASGPLNTASGAEVFHQYAAAGAYTPAVTARNVAGCSLTLDQTLEIFPNLLTGAISPDGTYVLCQGKTLTLYAPPVGVSYSWSNGASGQQITVGQTGLYALTVTDAMGCTFSPPAKEVNVLPAPDGSIRALLFNENDQIVGVETNALTVCAGETVHLYTNEQANHTYAWSSGGFGGVQEFSEVRNNLLPPGNYLYHITVTNALTGCTAVTQVFPVTVNPVPAGLAVSTDQNCAGTTANITYDGPQPPGWQYFWNNGATGPAFATTEPGHYFVRVVNEFGCAASSEKVTILPGPNIAALPSGCHRRCEPDTLCLPAMPEIATWQWFFNGVPIPGANGPDLVATESGVYWAELSDTSGCHAQSVPLTLELFTGTGDVLGSVWSDVNHNGVIDPADTLVSGIPVQLWQNGGIVSGGQSGTNGQFIFGNVPSVGGFVAVDGAALPVGWNIVIGQSPADLVGCAAVAQVGLLLAGPMPCLPTVGTLSAAACPGGSFDYNGTAVPAGTSQEFTLQNHLGCDSVLTVTVAEYPPIQFSLTTEKSCSDNPTGSVLVQNALGGLSPLEFSIDGLVFQQAPLFEDLSAGMHQIWIADAAGCVVEQTFSIDAIPALEFELPSLVLLACDGTPVTVQPTLIGVDTDISYLWWNGSTEAVVQVAQAGPIWLEVANACASIRKNTEVVWGTGVGDTTLAYIPNVLMPEAEDAQNAVFRPMFVPDVTVLEYLMEVYDRWGNLLFRAQQPEDGWAGTARGQFSMPGSYIWRLEVKALHCGQEIEIRKSGSVALVR